MKEIKIKKTDVFNFIIVFCLIFYKYFLMWNQKLSLNLNLNIMIIYILILTILMVSRKKIKKNLVLKLTIMIIFFVISYYKSEAIDILIAFVISFCFFDDDVGEQKFLKNFVISSSIMFIITIILFVLGILPDNTLQRWNGNTTIVRSSLGFFHANSPFLYFIPIVLAYYILKKDNLKKFPFLLIVDIISVIIYHFTICRTGLIVIIGINLCVLFEKYLIKNKIMNFTTKHGYLIFLMISVIIALKYGLDFVSPINNLLSMRPYYYYLAITQYGFHLFGAGVQDLIIIDNVYLTYTLIYGIVPFALFLLFQYKTFHRFKGNKMMIVMFLFFIYGMLENNFVYCNNFMLTLQFIFYLQNKEVIKDVKN